MRGQTFPSPVEQGNLALAKVSIGIHGNIHWLLKNKDYKNM